MTAMIEQACALPGRKGIKVGPDNDDIADDRGLQPVDLAMAGAPKTDDLNVSKAPNVANDLLVESTHIAVPELSHPGKKKRMDWRRNL